MQICGLLLTGQGWIQLRTRSSDDVNNRTDVKTFCDSLPATWEKAAAVWEMCSAAENMKIHHHSLQEHHVTYLKRSKEEVKLPRFNVHRQTADKQCSYLQTEHKIDFITWWIFGVWLLSEPKTGETIFQALAPAIVAPPQILMDLRNFYKQEATFCFWRNHRETDGSRPNIRNESFVNGPDEPVPAETETTASETDFDPLGLLSLSTVNSCHYCL